MVPDTGSQRCVLEAATALRCGVRTFAGSALRIQIGGASGAESALVGIPDAFSLGQWRWRGMPCLVRTSQSEMGGPWILSRRFASFNLLGMDALRGMCSYVTFDFPRGEVSFGFKQGFQPRSPGRSQSEPLVLRDGLPFVQVRCHDHGWWALLDTGSSTLVELNRHTARELGLDRYASAANATQIGLGQSDSASRNRLARATLPVTCLGQVDLNARVLIGNGASKIGGAWSTGRFTLDFLHSKLWVESD